jgi:hypothetical protein
MSDVLIAASTSVVILSAGGSEAPASDLGCRRSSDMI